MSYNMQRFMVEIVTSEPIEGDSNIDEMAQKIAIAIADGANGQGICPEDSGAYTQIVYVKGWYSDKQFIQHVYETYEL